MYLMDSVFKIKATGTFLKTLNDNEKSLRSEMTQVMKNTAYKNSFFLFLALQSQTLNKLSCNFLANRIPTEYMLVLYRTTVLKAAKCNLPKPNSFEISATTPLSFVHDSLTQFDMPP